MAFPAHNSEVILNYLDDLEDLHLAEKRLADIQKGKTKTMKLDEVERKLGFTDSRQLRKKKNLVKKGTIPTS